MGWLLRCAGRDGSAADTEESTGRRVPRTFRKTLMSPKQPVWLPAGVPEQAEEPRMRVLIVEDEP